MVNLLNLYSVLSILNFQPKKKIFDSKITTNHLPRSEPIPIFVTTNMGVFMPTVGITRNLHTKYSHC